MARTEQGDTPLMKAASIGCREIVEILLDHDSSSSHVNARSRNSLRSALHYASEFGYSSCVQALLATQECKVWLKDAYGATAIHAVTSCHQQNAAEVCRMLLDEYIKYYQEDEENAQDASAFLD